jgi:group I intron endonuclease
MTKISGVYEIVNSVNGKRYIGSSTNIPSRLRLHKWALLGGRHINPNLQCDWNLHGDKIFIFRQILRCDPEMIFIYEQLCLIGLKPEYNIANDAAVSARGLKRSDETRKRISLSLIGNHRRLGTPTPDAMRVRLREVNIGKKLADETKIKISQALKGRKKHPLSEETKAKLRVCSTGRAQSEATRLKRSASMKKAWENRR